MKNEISELDQFQSNHAAWASKTFPDETLDEVIKHLKAEIDEARETPSDVFEWADCYILMMYACQRCGHSMSDVVDIAKKKHEINLKRTWPGKNKEGIYQHAE